MRLCSYIALVAAVVLVTPRPLAQENPFENPPRFEPTEVLPADLIEGERYNVASPVTNDGFTNHYTIYSDFGTFEAPSDAFARERINEIRAMAKIEEIRRTTSYAEGAKAAGKSSLSAIKKVFTEPVETARSIPPGVKRFFGNVFRMTQGNRGEYEDHVAKELVGFSSAKRRIAFELGVDPYSSNQRLQDMINDLTWTSYAGGMSIEIIKNFVVPAPVSTGLLATDTTANVAEMVRDQSPESLQKINREKLGHIDLSHDTVEALLANPWYSPLRETALANALYDLRLVAGVDRYLRVAVSAESESEAYFFQRNAEMLRGYHWHIAPIERIYMVNRLPFAKSESGSLVTCMAVDYLCWLPESAAAFGHVRDQIPTDVNYDTVELWLTGRASEKTVTQLVLRDITIHHNATEQLIPELNE